ncbi:Uncharacterised protein [Candidatus Tiddalikarchaeum anstoanum]|nr:Uncharacterised protein [Candidatus Tiddalikarchaeum anstoanum]
MDYSDNNSYLNNILNQYNNLNMNNQQQNNQQQNQRPAVIQTPLPKMTLEEFKGIINDFNNYESSKDQFIYDAQSKYTPEKAAEVITKEYGMFTEPGVRIGYCEKGNKYYALFSIISTKFGSNAGLAIFDNGSFLNFSPYIEKNGQVKIFDYSTCIHGLVLPLSFINIDYEAHGVFENTEVHKKGRWVETEPTIGKEPTDVVLVETERYEDMNNKMSSKEMFSTHIGNWYRYKHFGNKFGENIVEDIIQKIVEVTSHDDAEFAAIYANSIEDVIKYLDKKEYESAELEKYRKQVLDLNYKKLANILIETGQDAFGMYPKIMAILEDEDPIFMIALYGSKKDANETNLLRIAKKIENKYLDLSLDLYLQTGLNEPNLDDAMLRCAKKIESDAMLRYAEKVGANSHEISVCDTYELIISKMNQLGVLSSNKDRLMNIAKRNVEAQFLTVALSIYKELKETKLYNETLSDLEDFKPIFAFNKYNENNDVKSMIRCAENAFDKHLSVRELYDVIIKKIENDNVLSKDEIIKFESFIKISGGSIQQSVTLDEIITGQSKSLTNMSINQMINKSMSDIISHKKTAQETINDMCNEIIAQYKREYNTQL